MGIFTRVLRRGRLFASVNYLDVTRHAGPEYADDPLRAEKPRAKSEIGVNLPLTAASSINLIGNLIGDTASGIPGQHRAAMPGILTGRLVFDLIAGIKTGPFTTILGVTNILDRRGSDPSLDRNGLHYNPGRNFFIQFISRF